MTPGRIDFWSMTDIAVGRRDRKRLATRQAIQEAALSLFMDRGFDAVSIE